MITFPMPTKLNGEQLIEELAAVKIKVNGYPEDWCDGLIRLDIAKTDESKASTIVANHIGIDREPTFADKLQSLGLTIEELKAALI